MMCSEKAKLYWNEKESKRSWNDVGLLQIHADETASMMEPSVPLMNLGHAVLLDSSVKPRQKCIYKMHAGVGFLHARYDSGGGGVK